MSLLMFDYDGVIVDSKELFVTHFTASCIECGFSQFNSELEVLPLFDGNLYEVMQQRGVPSEAIDKILKLFEKKIIGTNSEPMIFSGITEALEDISKDHIIYIITSNVSSIPRNRLLRHGINCFEDIIGADKEKSKIKKIEAVKKLHPSEEAYYIGDTKGDMIEGNNAGCITIGVTWGWHGGEKLLEGKPNFIVDSPQKILECLEGNGLQKSSILI